MLQLEGFDPTTIPGPKPSPLQSTRARQQRFLQDPVGGVLQLREFGDVVAVVEDDPAIVCVFGPERTREVLEQPTRFENLASFPHRRATTVALTTVDDGLPRMNGQLHQRHRQLLASAFAQEYLDEQAIQVVRVGQAFVDRWPVDGIGRVDDLCRGLVRGVVMSAFFGLPLDADTLALGELLGKLHEARTAPPSPVPELNLPGLPHRRAHLLAKAATKRLTAIIEAKRATSTRANDVLGRLVATGALSDAELVGQAVTLFATSHQPTASALAWTLFLLDQHADRLVAIQAELDEVLDERAPTRADLPRLGKLDRAVKESLRLLPPMPVLAFRVTAEATALASVELPKHANVVVSPLAIHHDAACYTDPQRFDPDRWFELTPRPFVYLPFGTGSRACLATAFANQTLRLLLAVILQRRRLRCRANTRVDRLSQGYGLSFKHGLPMRITRPKDPTDPARPVRGDVQQLITLPSVHT